MRSEFPHVPGRLGFSDSWLPEPPSSNGPFSPDQPPPVNASALDPISLELETAASVVKSIVGQRHFSRSSQVNVIIIYRDLPSTSPPIHPIIPIHWPPIPKGDFLRLGKSIHAPSSLDRRGRLPSPLRLASPFTTSVAHPTIMEGSTTTIVS